MIPQLSWVCQILQRLLSLIVLLTVLFPKALIVKIRMKTLEEGVIHLDFPTFKPLPVSIGAGSGNGEIDPVCGDVVLLGVVEDSLKWRKDL